MANWEKILNRGDMDLPNNELSGLCDTFQY